MVVQDVARAVAQHFMQRGPGRGGIERRVEELFDPGGIQVLGFAVPAIAQGPNAAACHAWTRRLVAKHGDLARDRLAVGLAAMALKPCLPSPGGGRGYLGKPEIRWAAMAIALIWPRRCHRGQSAKARRRKASPLRKSPAGGRLSTVRRASIGRRFRSANRKSRRDPGRGRPQSRAGRRKMHLRSGAMPPWQRQTDVVETIGLPSAPQNCSAPQDRAITLREGFDGIVAKCGRNGCGACRAGCKAELPAQDCGRAGQVREARLHRYRASKGQSPH